MLPAIKSLPPTLPRPDRYIYMYIYACVQHNATLLRAPFLLKVGSSANDFTAAGFEEDGVLVLCSIAAFDVAERWVSVIVI